MKTTTMDRLLTLTREKGILRTKDLISLGIPRTYLTRLVEKGQLQRISRGLYVGG